MRRLKLEAVEGVLIYVDVDSDEQFFKRPTHLGHIRIDSGVRRAYYLGNHYHRDDGPAIIWYQDKTKDKVFCYKYYLHDILYSEEEWLAKISKENRIKYLFRLNEWGKNRR